MKLFCYSYAVTSSSIMHANLQHGSFLLCMKQLIIVKRVNIYIALPKSQLTMNSRS